MYHIILGTHISTYYKKNVIHFVRLEVDKSRNAVCYCEQCLQNIKYARYWNILTVNVAEYEFPIKLINILFWSGKFKKYLLNFKFEQKYFG